MKLIYQNPIIKFEEDEAKMVNAMIRWIDHMSMGEYSAIQDAFGAESFNKLYDLLCSFGEFVYNNLEDNND